MYATVTSKGQITLPAKARRALGLHSGQKVAIHVGQNSLTIDAPGDIVSLRALAREQAQQAGTWGRPPASGEGWSHRAEDFRADR
ncbi:MAG: AbrB/MazE/SpoVT family DNA-binding domain-containing protein [Micrococcales bacterium]|nr:AbrB/MazE/SpoVT family DNA-binding domain-containing protein [Micrococcales bacterium]